MLCDRFGVSERRACRVVGQHRSTQRLEPPVVPGDEPELREFLRAFAKRRPRWGWRRAAKELRRAGWKVNNKRVRRLWRDEGLQVPTKTRKKRLSGRSEEHTSELQSLMRISYAVFCLKKKRR